MRHESEERSTKTTLVKNLKRWVPAKGAERKEEVYLTNKGTHRYNFKGDYINK